MRFSYFTRTLVVLVVAMSVSLIFFSETFPDSIGSALTLLLICLGGLAWSAARDASPLDSQAFHRTLPSGDVKVFRQVVILLLVVLGSIAAMITVYGMMINLSWLEIGRTSGSFLLIGGALSSACAVSASLSTSRENERILPALSVFFIPIISSVSAILFGLALASKFSPSWESKMLVVFVAYSFSWWLITIRSRRAMGLFVSNLLGIILPHYFIWGSSLFELDPRWTSPEHRALPEKEHFVKKDLGELGPRDNLVLNDIISAKNIGWDRFFAVGYICLEGVDMAEESYPRKEFPVEGLASGYYRDRRQPLYAQYLSPEKALWGISSEAGDALWGRNKCWKIIQRKMPLGIKIFESLRSDQPILEEVSSPQSSSSLGNSPQVTLPVEGADRDEFFDKLKAQPLKAETFEFSFEGPFIFEPMQQGRVKLEEGGVLRVKPVRSQTFSIRIDHYGCSSNKRLYLEPWVLLVDKDRGRAFRLNVGYYHTNSPWIGMKRSWLVNVPPDMESDESFREILQNSRIYVYWPKLESLSDPDCMTVTNPW